MSDEIALERLKEACAQVLSPVSQGTGYLVRADRLVTCAHVVAGVGIGGQVQTQFHRRESDGRVRVSQIAGVVEHLESADDWATVRLSRQPDGVRPLACAALPEAAARWVAFGYPVSAGSGMGLVINGVIRDPRGYDVSGRPFIQLYSDDAAAGQGPYLNGFSGSPVLHRGRVIGHLRRVLPDGKGRAEMGLVLACPVSCFEAQLPSAPPPPWNALRPEAGYDPLWYVHREDIEKVALNRLATPGSPAVLVAPENFGKAVLLSHLLDMVARQDLQAGPQSDVVRFELSKLSDAETERLDLLLGWFANQCIQQLRLNPKVARLLMDPALDDDPKICLREFLEAHVLSRSADRCLLVLQSANRLHGRPCATDFFALLRSLAEDTSPRYCKLRMLATVAIDPALLEKTDHSGFFGLRPPLLLGPLHREQMLKLADLYGFDLQTPGIEALFTLVGGHPHLLRWAFHEARQREVSLQHIVDETQRNPLESIFAFPLSRLRQYVREHQLLGPLSAVLKDPHCNLSDAAYAHLSRKGLVVETRAGQYKLRSPLFELYFSELCR